MSWRSLTCSPKWREFEMRRQYVLYENLKLILSFTNFTDKPSYTWRWLRQSFLWPAESFFLFRASKAVMTNGDFQSWQEAAKSFSPLPRGKHFVRTKYSQTKLSPPCLPPLSYAWNIYKILISARLVKVIICICICWDKALILHLG